MLMMTIKTHVCVTVSGCHCHCPVTAWCCNVCMTWIPRCLCCCTLCICCCTLCICCCTLCICCCTLSLMLPRCTPVPETLSQITRFAMFYGFIYVCSGTDQMIHDSGGSRGVRGDVLGQFSFEKTTLPQHRSDLAAFHSQTSYHYRQPTYIN